MKDETRVMVFNRVQWSAVKSACEKEYKDTFTLPEWENLPIVELNQRTTQQRMNDIIKTTEELLGGDGE